MSPLITAGIGLAKQWLSGKKAEDQRDDELELAIVEATGQAGRTLALAFLLGPWAAPLLPGITAAEVAAYLETVSAAIPGWHEAALKGALFGMWGLAERAGYKAKKARTEKARRRDHSAAVGGGR